MCSPYGCQELKEEKQGERKETTLQLLVEIFLMLQNEGKASDSKATDV